MKHINKPDMRRDCCYINCPRPGTILIGENGNPDREWICRYHRDKWHAQRARFIADGLPCAMETMRRTRMDYVHADHESRAAIFGQGRKPAMTANEENPATQLPVRTELAPHHRGLEYHLDCGRDVYVEEIRIALSTLGHYAGSADAIRAEVIRRLPDRAFDQFPGSGGVLVKPVPEGELPAFTFMVSLACRQPVFDPAADFSGLVVCWFTDDVETSLPEMIHREICSVEWDKHAVDVNF